MFGQQSYVLVDFSNLVYISFFAAYRGGPTDEIPMCYNEHANYFQKSIANLRKWNGMADFVYAIDSRPTEKYKIYPEYKQGRNKLSHKDGSRFDAQEVVFKTMGPATTIRADGYEADDAIAAFVANHFDDEVIVVTTDRDLWQLCDYPNCRVFDPIKKEYIGENHIREKFCRKDKHKIIHEHLTSFGHIKLWKALWGDSSDNIKNMVPRMQKQLLPVIGQTDGSLESFYEKAAEAELTPKCKELLENSKEGVKLNEQLVRLNFTCEYVTTQINQPTKPEAPSVNHNILDLDKIF